MESGKVGVIYTKEQQKVIDTHGCSLLVSAAAGSGKTAVLVERIVKMISDGDNPVDIDRLLVVTFTNAAAAQMRERIRNVIGLKLISEPENEHLQRQMTLLHNAQITTIDSFCLFVIRNYFHTIGLDPGFRIADEGELRLLKADVLADVLERQYSDGDENFLNCMEYFSTGSRDKAVEEAVLKLYDFAMSNPFPEEWLEERKADYSGAEEWFGERKPGCFESEKWVERLMNNTGLLLKGALERINMCIAICEEPDGPHMYGELLDREKEKIEGLIDASDYERRYERFAGLTFDRLSSKKDETVSAVKREIVKNARTEIKELLQSIQKDYFSLPQAEISRQAAACSTAVCALADLTLIFKEEFDQAKRDKNILDFDDIEHFALAILLRKSEDGSIVPNAPALEYREHFAEILIDEYQDSNLVQEYLLSVISGEADRNYNRFMVGDVKQSIYKFRLARPEIFMEKYNAYGLEGSESMRIDLHKNFRSREEVLTSANAVFSQVMIKELGGIDYDEKAALFMGASYPAAAAAHDNDTELVLYNAEDREEEAYAIASRIKRLVASFQVTDEETGLLRKASYRDIVILLRTTTGWDEEFKRILEEEGIPAHVTSKTGYFASTEIRELLHFLRILDNPIQDIPLYGVLHSVFGGFTEEEIALIKAESRDRRHTRDEKAELQDKEHTHDERAESENKVHDEEPELQGKRHLYDAVAEYASVGSDNALREKIKLFISKIGMYRDMAVYMPVHELLQEIIRDYSYLSYVAAKPGGSRRRGNVEMLIVKAVDYEKTSYYGLYHFLRYIEQLEKYDVDYGEANLQDENADVVRIMSIHKSKGLEFPICFVAGLSKSFNNRDANAHLVMDVEEGIGVDYIDAGRRVMSRNLRRNYIASKIRQDNLAEELRILYVAMTRAKEKLILIGTIKNMEKKAASLSLIKGCKNRKLPYDMLLQADSFMDILLYSAARNKCFDKVWEEYGQQPADTAEFYKEEMGIQVSVLKYEDIAGDEIKETIEREENRRKLVLSSMAYKAGELDVTLMKTMEERFSYQYPYECLKDLYAKTTVSELKKAGMKEEIDFSFPMFDEETIVPYLPKFIKQEDTVSGTERGSAYHKAMELFDFKSLLGADSEEARKELVDVQLKKMIDDGKMPQSYRDVISPQKILKFTQSSAAGRMAHADVKGKLYKEQPFVLGLPANRLNDAFPPEETVLIQGIIDVFFEEDGKFVVLDYKTDVVKTEEELIKRYHTQLDYYAEALGQLLGGEQVDIKMDIRKIIYSFALGKEIMVE
ncbi:MAG: helicase-exonuclease AddAB subunit AddA [Butyrivibrio sp.]|nr:helicase-exonuclease AddAB subunit AddA [Butyrivibrio sp.]